MEKLEESYKAVFVNRDSDSVTIKIRDNEEVYNIIKVYEFNSDKKMMSVTVKRQSDGLIFNFAKGADMAITKRLKEVGEKEIKMMDLLNSFADNGLRTLMFAMRELKLEDTPDDLENDEKFEKEYDLLGVTGVEDLLQDNVR